MGTNYYLYQAKEPSEPALHIGKSSYGWCFSLHVMPELGINTLDDWKALFNNAGAYILDEYGDKIHSDDMLDIISKRERYSSGQRFTGKSKIPWCPYQTGYASEEDFHKKNNSERGPLGLLRHKVDSHCIGHGDGTYDYMLGYFT